MLIERLDLTFDGSLSVLTGETGAGKSILLDSLSLALGARADSGLVRKGAERLQVTAQFDPPLDHPARRAAAEQGIEIDGEPLILRRLVTADGRSRAYLNDQAVSVGLLRQIGDELVEIHGQFDNHGLMNPVTHQGVLDAYGATRGEREASAAAHRAWRAAAKAYRDAETALAQARADEELLRHNLDELAALDPKPGEEAQLAEKRAVAMNAEKLSEGLDGAFAALSRSADVEGALRKAMASLQKVAAMTGGTMTPVIEGLDRAAIEVNEAVGELERISSEIDLDPAALEKLEERLFALRGVARKHGCAVDDLAALRDRFAAGIVALDDGGADLAKLAKAEQAARDAYLTAARVLSKARADAAGRLDAAMAAELPPLKLDKARFQTSVTPSDDPADWTAEGLDAVEFRVATNPGQDPGPIGKIASGGELARFMLALKVVLAGASPIPTLVFDEVDTGIGGATADAVGERLAKLGERVQVLVVTHSPQVAARGTHHMRVQKSAAGDQDTPATDVLPLSPAMRREEIARMLSGAQITDQARAAAEQLLGR